MSPAESNVIVDPVIVSMTGLVRVLLVKRSRRYLQILMRASVQPVLGSVSVLLALAE